MPCKSAPTAPRSSSHRQAQGMRPGDVAVLTLLTQAQNHVIARSGTQLSLGGRRAGGAASPCPCPCRCPRSPPSPGAAAAQEGGRPRSTPASAARASSNSSAHFPGLSLFPATRCSRPPPPPPSLLPGRVRAGASPTWPPGDTAGQVPPSSCPTPGWGPGLSGLGTGTASGAVLPRGSAPRRSTPAPPVLPIRAGMAPNAAGS